MKRRRKKRWITRGRGFMNRLFCVARDIKKQSKESRLNYKQYKEK